MNSPQRLDGRRRRRCPSAIHDAAPGRIDVLDDELATYLTALRDAASTPSGRRSTPRPATRRPPRRATEAVTALTDIGDTASRILASFVPAIPDRTDVVWLEHEDNRGSMPCDAAGGAAVGVRVVAQPGCLSVRRRC